jgi:hypothetical protein
VYGDVNNTITWNTASNLGTINNGDVSELYISATSTENLALTYSLVNSPGVSCALPQGLSLLSDGTISGRVSFESFTLDQNKTTFDNNKSGFDHSYTFFAQAATPNSNATIVREFTIQVAIKDPVPYVNVYLHTLAASAERAYFNNVVNNTAIFDPSYIYRPQDPWYGVQTTPMSLFLSGLKSMDLDTIESIIAKNHYTKTYNFGEIKTATVLDEVFNVKYEVVYVELLDPEEVYNSVTKRYNGPGLQLDLTTANGYIDSEGMVHRTVYPNTSDNMSYRLTNNGANYQNQSTLPAWMTSNQVISTKSSSFSTPLGYTRAVVLAYTLPEKSKLIAYRLRSANIDFKQFQFTVDRYEVDNYYSTNFDSATGTYVSTAKETTFDLGTKQIGSIAATVNYAVDVPFDQINGRTINYINDLTLADGITKGGIDGVTNFRDGETLIFYTQENFPRYNVNSINNGWNYYTDAYVGDNVLTATVEGYDSAAFDSYAFVPGYFSSVAATTTLTGDGATKVFRITQNVTNKNQINVYINGILQNPITYNVSGSVLTFNQAPQPTPVASTPATISVFNGTNLQTFTGNGVQTAFILNARVATPTRVTVNGIDQSSNTYSVTSTTVTAANLVPGQSYTVVTPGNTDWGNIGFVGKTSTVTTGTTFTASNVGSGTGTAKYSTITFNTAPALVSRPSIPPTIRVVSTTASQNQQGGVWQINIVNNVVNLTFVKEIAPNQRISVVNGRTHIASIVFYNPNTTGTHTVPYYSTYIPSTGIGTSRTTFNNNTTRFFNYRDSYYTPGSQAKYIKFPQYGVFK